MRIAIIGRTEILYNVAVRLKQAGHAISCILTAKEAPEYTRTADDFKSLAEQWRIPFAHGPRIVEHIDFLNASTSDIALSVNYPGVVPQEVIDIFPLGILNAHGGDLPRYRGNACQAWAILNGEDRIGLCIHRMIGGELDSGDIIARDYLPIDLTTKVTKAWNWMVERAPPLMLEAAERLARDPKYVLERQSKNPSEVIRCYSRRPEDGRIDWCKPALDIVRLVNASGRPYAGAFCFHEDQQVTVWEARLGDGERFLAIPGQVTAITDDYLEVATGAGKVRLTQLTLDGVPMRPAAVCKSIRSRMS